MTSPPRIPHPKNVAGPFYVESGCCLSCDIPVSEAPGNFEYDSDFHCYVFAQPQTQEETTRMIRVAWAAELQCIRYRGTDPGVLRRLAELELRDICDVDPPAHIRPIIRNHARFTIRDESAVTSKQLLQDFIAHLNSESTEWRSYRTNRIKMSESRSSFEFAWYENHFHPVIFASILESPNEYHVEYSLKGELGDRGVGNVISEWLQINSDRFTNVRWYTDDEWLNGGPSRSTLW